MTSEDSESHSGFGRLISPSLGLAPPPVSPLEVRTPYGNLCSQPDFKKKTIARTGWPLLDDGAQAPDVRAARLGGGVRGAHAERPAAGADARVPCAARARAGTPGRPTGRNRLATSEVDFGAAARRRARTCGTRGARADGMPARPDAARGAAWCGRGRCWTGARRARLGSWWRRRSSTNGLRERRQLRPCARPRSRLRVSLPRQR